MRLLVEAILFAISFIPDNYWHLRIFLTFTFLVGVPFMAPAYRVRHLHRLLRSVEDDISGYEEEGVFSPRTPEGLQVVCDLDRSSVVLARYLADCSSSSRIRHEVLTLQFPSSSADASNPAIHSAHIFIRLYFMIQNYFGVHTAITRFNRHIKIIQHNVEVSC
jgi:hypothetical protein